ncbi:killer cell lectin-like receptor subfamily F member 1 [Eublepharis macularius]|uniref:Killer cell lectin-like receptor subfamily F member 1 n=1 Tax=Eublepharis macularius TaxID=481883 RepID=A0AA97KUY9_EUBMA|nr:killer cell lectin-like receptor subfamily F member 1 [Eublepharis macularius]
MYFRATLRKSECGAVSAQEVNGMSLGVRVAETSEIRQSADILMKASISWQPNNGTHNKSSLENFVSHLRKFMCKPRDSKITGNFSCRLCPQNWSLHENKCYWVSKERRTWHKGKEDCTAKLSHMVVIQNQEEVAFIQSITDGAQLLWIGLEATFPEKKWTWIDGSPLDDKLFQDLGPVETNCCGRLNGDQLISEVCSTIAAWICETKALLI